MKLTNSQLKEIIEEMKKEGHDVGVRDIAYVFLCRRFEESVYAFRALFGKSGDEDFVTYSQSDRIEELTTLMAHMYPEPKDAKSEAQALVDKLDGEASVKDEGLTFDEIKKGLEEDLEALIKIRDDVDEEGKSRLDPKDFASVVARIADIRVKLTEKFGSKVKSEEQRVVVMNKYNDICPYCNHEISRMQ